MFNDSFENSKIRFIMIDAGNDLYQQYLSTIISKYSYRFCYVRFSGNNLELEEAKNQFFDQYDLLEENILPDILILDECDRLAEHIQIDFFQLLEKFGIPKTILFSRQLLQSIIIDPELSPLTFVISESNVAPSYNYETPVIDVSGFGVGQVRVNGFLIDLRKTPLIHKLFFYVLESESISREDVIQKFWSDVDEESAIKSFHANISNLNKLLGVEFLMYSHPLHSERNPNVILRYDVADYRSQLSSILHIDTGFTAIYQDAYNLYQGDFLTSYDCDWIVALRDKLREQHSDVCYNLAQSGSTAKESLGYYAQSFRLKPYREDAVAKMMELYLDANLSNDAQAVYRVLENNLKEKFNILPNKNLRKLSAQAKANPKTW